jgi:cation transport regulator ChaC
VAHEARGSRSTGGVFLFDDFRDNLIIDRYDVGFLAMRGSKTDSMRSENSEDALTWNVFRSLAQVDPSFWLPGLFRDAFGRELQLRAQSVRVRLWQRVQPPPALRLFQKDEGDSEIDVLIETEQMVWFIEAKFRSDVSERTTNNPERDQILRNLDVGTWYAGVREFYFSLLLMDAPLLTKGTAIVERYAASTDEVARRLPHRPDRLANLRGTGVLRWSQLASVLTACAAAAPRADERGYAQRAVDWLKTKSIRMPVEQNDTDRFLYFGYGSNMLTRRLADPRRAPTARAVGIGYVEKHKLTFDKISRGTELNSGKCDMEATGNEGERVYGVLFSISTKDEAALDREEGLDRGYRKDRRVKVITADGEKTAVAYIATEKDPALLPYHWYRDFVIEGALEHGLPDEYVTWLRAFRSQPDPDRGRREENERILGEHRAAAKKRP